MYSLNLLVKIQDLPLSGRRTPFLMRKATAKTELPSKPKLHFQKSLEHSFQQTWENIQFGVVVIFVNV